MRIAVFVLVMLATGTTAQAQEAWKPPVFAESDRAVFGVLQSRLPETKDLERIHRVGATPELDLVVTFGFIGDGGGSGHWGTAFGTFLQRRDRPSLVYEISIRSSAGTEMSVERATATDLVLSASREGETLPTEKLVFDPRSKALVRHFEYERWTMGAAFPHGPGAVFLATNHDRVVAFEFEPTRERPFEMLSADEAVRWSKRVRIFESEVVIGTATRGLADGMSKTGRSGSASTSTTPRVRDRHRRFRLVRRGSAGVPALVSVGSARVVHRSDARGEGHNLDGSRRFR